MDRILTFRFACMLVLASSLARQTVADESTEFFESKIRPLLAKHCYACHSASAKKVEAGLRLDHRSLMLQGGDSGSAIQLDDPGRSLLLQAVRYETFEMPPSGKLPPADIELLKQWIEKGAPWPTEPVPERQVQPAPFDLSSRIEQHWVWRPRIDPPVPSIENDAWSCDPIDRFVLESAIERGLPPNGSAERPVLVRRLYLDLLGLPPSVDELESHLRDVSPDWYERMVDQLLASPQFGVRFARHWLDLVRYAESRGHEFDEDVAGANHYRDYVVRAFNQDLPFDRFATEQIAGDLLPNPRIDSSRGWNESTLGTGFWHLGEWVHSPVDSRKDESDRFDNMVDVFSKTFLGMTVACSRCHDHKFDAISTSDYYALFGYLRSSHFRMVRFQACENNRLIEARRQQIRDQMQGRWAQSLDAITDSLLQDRKGIEQLADSLAPRPKPDANPSPLVVASPLTSDDPRVRIDFGRRKGEPWYAEGVGFGSGPVANGSVDLLPGKQPSLRWHPLPAAHFDAYWGPMQSKVDAINHKNNYSQVDSAGRTLFTKTFILESDQLSYLVRGPFKAFAAVDSMRLLAGPLHGETLREFKDDAATGYRWVSHSLGRYRGKELHLEFFPIKDQAFEVVQVIDGPPPPLEKVDLTPERLNGVLQAFRSDQEAFSRSSSMADRMVLNAILQRLGTPGDGPFSDKLVPIATLLNDWRQEYDALAKETRWDSYVAMAMIDGSGVNHPIFVRGNHENPGSVVPRRFLEALGAKPVRATSTSDPGSGRLALAQSVIDPANPLTARVLVNRLWHHLLGRGIVATVDDLGVQGQRPTHPELLDFLATRLIENDWSVKQAIRSIVLSKTYRMSSVESSIHRERDPDNQWLSRARVRRLEAEAIRDTLLSISGKLDRRLEGPSVPVHLTEFLQGRGRPPKSGPADGDGRRSLFIMIRRNFLAPMMTTFDAPNPFSTMGRRNVSSVPAQSLMLLNDPLVHELAKQWSRSVLKGTSNDRQRIEQMFLTAFARRPTADEESSAIAFLQEGSSPNGLDEGAWHNLAHVLLNMKELILRF